MIHACIEAIHNLMTIIDCIGAYIDLDRILTFAQGTILSPIHTCAQLLPLVVDCITPMATFAQGMMQQLGPLLSG